MHKYGIFIHDIDIVIITHEHIDHTCDIRTIDDLNYQLNSLTKKQHFIDWYWDSETDKIYRYALEGSYNRIQIINNISDNPFENLPILLDKNIYLRPIQTKHILNEDGITYKNHTFGFVLELKSDRNDVKVGYTSDTSYFPDMAKFYSDMDLLIANISSIHKSDLLCEVPKSTHLGFMGCISLLKQMKKKPQYFIISEFWCGKDDIRFDIAKYLSSQLRFVCENAETKILPSELDLTIDLSTLNIRCSCCSEFDSSIKVINCTHDFGKIKYVCSSCLYLE